MGEIMDRSWRAKRRHRVPPEAPKREIVAACEVPGVPVSIVARHYRVNNNLVFVRLWRFYFVMKGTLLGLSARPGVKQHIGVFGA